MQPQLQRQEERPRLHPQAQQPLMCCTTTTALSMLAAPRVRLAVVWLDHQSQTSHLLLCVLQQAAAAAVTKRRQHLLWRQPMADVESLRHTMLGQWTLHWPVYTPALLVQQVSKSLPQQPHTQPPTLLAAASAVRSAMRAAPAPAAVTRVCLVAGAASQATSQNSAGGCAQTVGCGRAMHWAAPACFV